MALLHIDAADPAAPAAAAAAAAAIAAGRAGGGDDPRLSLCAGPAGLCPTESLYARPPTPPPAGRRRWAFAAVRRQKGWRSASAGMRAARSGRPGGAAARAGGRAGAGAGGGRARRAPARSTSSAHSLGARVALTAAGLAAPGAVGRMILLAAAVFRGEAQAVLATAGGQAAEVVNVTSRENDLFDLALERCIRGQQRPGAGRRPGRDAAATGWTSRSTMPRCAAALGHPRLPGRAAGARRSATGRAICAPACCRSTPRCCATAPACRCR